MKISEIGEGLKNFDMSLSLGKHIFYLDITFVNNYCGLLLYILLKNITPPPPPQKIVFSPLFTVRTTKRFAVAGWGRGVHGGAKALPLKKSCGNFTLKLSHFVPEKGWNIKPHSNSYAEILLIFYEKWDYFTKYIKLGLLGMKMSSKLNGFTLI